MSQPPSPCVAGPLPADAPTIGLPAGNAEGGRCDMVASLSHAVETDPEPAHDTDGSGPWNVGDVIRGTYEVREIRPGVLFAEGGLGVVHRIWHREWGIELAVKSPKPQAITSKQGKANYENEAHHWLQLRLHPHIVSCYMVRRIGDIPRLFAEYVADGSLWDWIRDGRLYRGGPDVSRSRIVDMLIQFAWGLSYAHRQGLLHLDVKPANVMLSGTTVKVTDFGLAVPLVRDNSAAALTTTAPAATNVVTTNAVTGDTAPIIVGLTPHYCSPEQFALYLSISRQQTYDGYPIAVQSDIWSFAVTAMAMLMRQVPAKSGPEARESLERFYQRATPAEMAFVPRGLLDILFACLEKSPEKRPASMNEVATRLISLYRDNFGMEYPRTEPEELGVNVESLNNRAASLIDLGQHREAEETFVQAENLTPWHPLVTYNKTLHAWRCAWVSDVAAVEKMQTLTRMQPENAAAWLALGRVFRERGDIWKATAAIEKARTFDDRLDIQQAFESTSLLTLSDVKISKQFTIPKERFVNIYISDRENLLLIVPATGDLWAHGILDSAIDLRLTRTTPVADSARVALSRDFHWELLADPASNALRLCRVGLTVTRSRFHHIAWQTLYSAAANEAPWRLQVLADQPGTVQATHRTDRSVVTLAEGTESISSAAVSADGHWVLTGGYFGTVRLWEMPRGRCLRTFSPSGDAAPIEGIYWTANSAFALVLRRDLHIDVIELSLLTQHAAKCRAPYILSMMTSVEHTSRLQSEVKQSVQSLEQTIRRGDVAAAVTNLTRLQSLPGWETTRRNLQCWDAIYRRLTRMAPQDSVCTRSFACADQVSAIALSANANVMVASGRDPVLCVWDFNRSTTPNAFIGHSDWVRAAAMTSDAKFAITGSWDASVRTWNLSTGKTVRAIPVAIPMLSDLVLNNRGTIVAVVNEAGGITVWDMSPNKILSQWSVSTRGVHVVCFSRDDTLLAVGGDGGRVVVRDWRRGENVYTFSVGSAPVTALALTADQAYCIVGDASGRLTTWDLKQRTSILAQRPHRGEITGLQLFIDDNWCGTTSRDRAFVISHLHQEKRRTVAWHSSAFTSFATDYSGTHAATGGEDGNVQVRELYWDFQVPSPDFGRASRVVEAIVTSLHQQQPQQLVEIDSLARRRIYAEMAYRGFGLLDDKLIDRMIDSVSVAVKRT